MSNNIGMSCVLIDDGKSVNTILNHMSIVNYVDVRQSFTSHYEALSYLVGNPVDLIISEIDIDAGLNGINMLSSIPGNPMVIIITEREDYVHESFSLNIVDYCLKPISFKRLMQSVNKAYVRLMSRHIQTSMSNQMPMYSPVEERDYSFIKVENHFLKVMKSDILCVEANGDYIKIYKSDSTRIMSLQSMNSIEKSLGSRFMRIHRSWIVSLDKIDKIEHNRVFVADMIIPVSSTYIKELMVRIGID